MARAQVLDGKRTHDREGGLVVFMVGMRVNKPWKVRTWWPVFTSFPRMLQELYQDPSTGFLGYTGGVRGRGTIAVTYWRDLDSLMAYAHSTTNEHRPAWTAFNRLSRQSEGVVGIWHETYVVPPGGHESLYVGMPSLGLPKAVGTVEVTSKRDSQRARLNAS